MVHSAMASTPEPVTTTRGRARYPAQRSFLLWLDPARWWSVRRVELKERCMSIVFIQSALAVVGVVLMLIPLVSRLAFRFRLRFRSQRMIRREEQAQNAATRLAESHHP